MRLRLIVGLLCLALGACARKADLIISGGLVWTGLSTGAPHAGAVAIAGGRILAIGDSAQVGRYAGPKTQWIEADGGLVLPGFTDGHTHFIDGGFQLASVSLRDAATRQSGAMRDPKPNGFTPTTGSSCPASPTDTPTSSTAASSSRQ